jgi:hypothetical protein
MYNLMQLKWPKKLYYHLNHLIKFSSKYLNKKVFNFNQTKTYFEFNLYYK